VFQSLKNLFAPQRRSLVEKRQPSADQKCGTPQRPRLPDAAGMGPAEGWAIAAKGPTRYPAECWGRGRSNAAAIGSPRAGDGPKLLLFGRTDVPALDPRDDQGRSLRLVHDRMGRRGKAPPVVVTKEIWGFGPLRRRWRVVFIGTRVRIVETGRPRTPFLVRLPPRGQPPATDTLSPIQNSPTSDRRKEETTMLVHHGSDLGGPSHCWPVGLGGGQVAGCSKKDGTTTPSRRRRLLSWPGNDPLPRLQAAFFGKDDEWAPKFGHQRSSAPQEPPDGGSDRSSTSEIRPSSRARASTGGSIRRTAGQAHQTSSRDVSKCGETLDSQGEGPRFDIKRSMVVATRITPPINNGPGKAGRGLRRFRTNRPARTFHGGEGRTTSSIQERQPTPLNGKKGSGSVQGSTFVRQNGPSEGAAGGTPVDHV